VTALSIRELTDFEIDAVTGGDWGTVIADFFSGIADAVLKAIDFISAFEIEITFEYSEEYYENGQLKTRKATGHARLGS
jgi:hypothetical protein